MEAEDPEVWQFSDEPYKNNSDGYNVVFLMVFCSCSVFSSLSSLLVLRAESMCGLTTAIQKERISCLVHGMIKENMLIK